MAGRAKSKNHPLPLRLPDNNIAIIDFAAALQGQSRNDFIREAAVRAAEMVVMESAPIRISPKGFNAFASVIALPGAAIPEMVEVLRRLPPWKTGRRKK